MSFEWSDYHTLAKGLQSSIDGNFDEAKLRCALSRAYYAAFCTARNLLLRTDTRLNDEISHSAVRNEFRQRGRRGVFVAGKLESMSLLRNKADYRDTFPELAKETETVIIDAKKVIEMVSNWKKLNNPPASS